MGSAPLDRSWASATWQGARDNALRLGESMTLEEKLAWLESAEALAEELRAGKGDSGESQDPGPAA